LSCFDSSAYFSGYGVFTAKAFEKGAFLLNYNGDLIPAREGEKREKFANNMKVPFPRTYLYFFAHGEKQWWLVLLFHYQIVYAP